MMEQVTSGPACCNSALMPSSPGCTLLPRAGRCRPGSTRTARPARSVAPSGNPTGTDPARRRSVRSSLRGRVVGDHRDSLGQLGLCRLDQRGRGGQRDRDAVRAAADRGVEVAGNVGDVAVLVAGRPSILAASARPLRVGTKKELVVTWLMNTNFQAGGREVADAAAGAGAGRALAAASSALAATAPPPCPVTSGHPAATAPATSGHSAGRSPRHGLPRSKDCSMLSGTRIPSRPGCPVGRLGVGESSDDSSIRSRDLSQSLHKSPDCAGRLSKSVLCREVSSAWGEAAPCRDRRPGCWPFAPPRAPRRAGTGG